MWYNCYCYVILCFKYKYWVCQGKYIVFYRKYLRKYKFKNKLYLSSYWLTFLQFVFFFSSAENYTIERSKNAKFPALSNIATRCISQHLFWDLSNLLLNNLFKMLQSSWFIYVRTETKVSHRKKKYSLGDQWGLGISPIQDITRLGNFYSISTIVISAKTKLLVCRGLILMKCPCFLFIIWW